MQIGHRSVAFHSNLIMPTYFRQQIPSTLANTKNDSVAESVGQNGSFGGACPARFVGRQAAASRWLGDSRSHSFRPTKAVPNSGIGPPAPFPQCAQRSVE